MSISAYSYIYTYVKPPFQNIVGITLNRCHTLNVKYIANRLIYYWDTHIVLVVMLWKLNKSSDLENLWTIFDLAVLLLTVIIILIFATRICKSDYKIIMHFSPRDDRNEPLNHCRSHARMIVLHDCIQRDRQNMWFIMISHCCHCQTNSLWKSLILIKISLKFIPKGLIHNVPALVQIIAWRRPGEKPLSELMLVSLLTLICVTWPQWGKANYGSTSDSMHEVWIAPCGLKQFSVSTDSMIVDRCCHDLWIYTQLCMWPRSRSLCSVTDHQQ